MLRALSGALSAAGRRSGAPAVQSGRPSTMPRKLTSVHAAKLLVSKRFASGNMFGVGEGSSKPIGEVASNFTFKAPNPTPKKSGSKSTKKKIVKRKSKNMFDKPETPTLSNLKDLKKLLAQMPEGFMDTLDYDTQTFVRQVQSGEADKMDPSKINRLLENASRSAQLQTYSDTSNLLRSGYSRESRKVEEKIDMDEQMEVLAQESAQRLLALSDDDWKSVGLEKPDFSKPLGFDQLAQLDRFLGVKGISAGDFTRYLSKAELDRYEIKDSLLKPSTEPAQSLMEKERTKRSKKKKPELEFDLEASDELMDKRRKLELIRRNVGLKPGDLTRTLTSLVKKQEYRRAVELFEDALTWDVKMLGFEPVDMTAINTIILIHCFSKDVTKALRTYDLIDQYHFLPNTATFNSFISMGAAMRDDRVCLDWYKRLLESNVAQPDSLTFGAMISVYAQMGDTTNALKWFAEMRQKVSKPDSTPYAHLIHMYGIVLDDVPEALKWAQQMLKDEVPRNEFTSSIISDLHRKLQHKKAQENRAERDRTKSPQELLIEALHENNHANVEKLWDTLRYNNANIRENLWSAMITYYARVAKLERAVQLFNDMQQEGFTPSRATCSAMVPVYRRLGDMDKAQETLKMVDGAPATEPTAAPGKSDVAPNYATTTITSKSGFKL